MKSLLNMFIVLFFVESLNFQGQSMQQNQTIPKGQFKCNQQLLSSYLLKGRRFSSPGGNILCPTVQKNCCTKLDQQRIYHIVNEILPQRTLEYQSKMKMAMGKLKQLYIKIIRNQPQILGSPERKLFCGQEFRKLMNYPFKKLYQDILNALDEVRHEMDSFYQGFPCLLCDGRNHRFFQINKQGLGSVTINSEWCQETLKTHQRVIRLFNVRVIQFFRVLQNVVDCQHYLKSYNLTFFERAKDILSHSTDKCLKSVGSPAQFKKNCKNVCNALQLSKINWLIEGDFEFVIDAINLFEKFYDFKEVGSFITMKMRAFFQKFKIARKLNRQDEDLFYDELKRKENQYNQRYLKQVGEKTEEAPTEQKEEKLDQGRRLQASGDSGSGSGNQ